MSEKESHTFSKATGPDDLAAATRGPDKPSAMATRAHNDSTAIHVPEEALCALNVLEQAGFEAWFVGGFVRDALLGRPCDDIDITTVARWQQTQEAFHAAGYRTHETGVKHGTVTAIVGSSAFEVTTYRTDGTYSDARHPDSVEFVESVDDDLARRDFTVNAMAYHPVRGLRDPYGGADDLRSGIVRTVGDPTTRFSEDALRILRAVRFASQRGFIIEPATEAAMRANAQLLHAVSAERVRAELQKMLCGDYVHDAIMKNVDVLIAVLPELAPMRGFDQRTPYHIFDVLEHSAYVVQNTPPYPLARWTALFHDMGKPAAFFTDEDGTGHFYGHGAISVEIAESIMLRLKMGPRFIHDAKLLVRYHDDVIKPVPKQVKRLLGRLDGRVDLFRTLCDIKRADALSQAPQCAGRVELANDLDACLTQILEAKEPFSLKDVDLNGSDVLALGVAPGPQVGELLQAALDAVIDEQVPNSKGALMAYAKGLLQKKDR